MHSSNTSAMSEPSAAWTSIDVSGAHEALRAVDVGAKAHALLLDREDAARAVGAARRAALDLVGDGAVAHREDLEAARVGDDRPLPAHELVQPAEARDELVAGLEEQVERVAEDHVVAERGDLARLEALDRRLRRERDERRACGPSPCGGAQDPGARARDRGPRRDLEGAAATGLARSWSREACASGRTAPRPRPADRAPRGRAGRGICARTPARCVGRASASFCRPAGVSLANAPRASSAQARARAARRARGGRRGASGRCGSAGSDCARSHMRIRSSSASARYMSTS